MGLDTEGRDLSGISEPMLLTNPNEGGLVFGGSAEASEGVYRLSKPSRLTSVCFELKGTALATTYSRRPSRLAVSEEPSQENC